MGKIGDLIVRLQLKHEDYKKGLKQAEKETKGFAGKLEKIKGIGLAVWGAIGGAMLKMASDLIKSTNSIEDTWEMFTSKAKAGWNSFMRTLANGDWSNFIRDFKKSIIAAEYLTAALQDTTEAENSIKLQKAAMAEELAALQVLMRDQTKTDKERAAAAESYINKMLPLYDQEIARLYELKKAYMIDFGKGLFNENLSPKVMSYVEKFLIEYGKLTKYGDKTLKQLMDAALVAYDPQAGLSVNKKRMPEAYAAQQERVSAIRALRGISKSWFPELPEDFLYALGQKYETANNGESITALVDIITKYDAALGAKDDDLRKVYTLLHSLEAKMLKGEGEGGNTESQVREFGALIEKLPSITAPAMAMQLPDIIPDDWLERNREKIDAALAEAERLAGITDEINRSFESAIVSSVSGATQALTDCIAGIEGADATQVLAALMQPFADTMIQLGEMLIAEGLAIKAFKESLEKLDPWVALAAGAGLLALGSALSSGIRKLGATAGSGATTTSTAASSSTGIENIQTELTIYVKGSLKGSDIVLSGQRTLNSWAR